MNKPGFYVALILFFGFNIIYPQTVLSLEESKQLALQNNVKNKNSRLKEQAAGQVKKSAFTKYFPTISAGGAMFKAQDNLMEMKTAGGNLPVYDGNIMNLASATQFAYFPSTTTGLLKKGTIGFINAIQPVFAGGRIYNGNRLAELGQEVSAQQVLLAANETNLKTEEMYWQIVSLTEKDKTLKSYETLLKSLQAQVADAYKAGIALKNDLLKVELKLSEVRLNKSKLDNGRKLASMAFCQYVGIKYDSLLVLNEELAVKDMPQSYFAENSEALKKRTEYSLLEKSVEAEHLQTSMKMGEFLPQAGIGVSGMYMKFDEGDSRTLGMVFGTVSVPISDWWGGSHELQERKLKEQMAENDFKNNSELLILQMEKAWQEFTDSYKQYLLCLEALAQADENVKLNEDSYKNGVVHVSDLLDAQALWQQAKDKLSEAKTDYLVKKTNYLQVTGR